MNSRLGCILLGLGLIMGGIAVGNASAEDKANANAAAKKPSLKFEEPQYNFGTIAKGDKVEHEFKFKNVGNDVLKINKVNTSCGCTAAVTSSQEIPPGGEGTIKATFNSGNFIGPITKTIFVDSNDPDQSLAKLILTGTIETEVMTTPTGQIFFGMIEQGQTPVQTFNLKQNGQRELNVLKAEIDLPFITTKVVPENGGGKKGYNVELSLNPTAPTGRFDGKLKVSTNIPGFTTIERPVSGIVKPKAGAAATTPETKAPEAKTPEAKAPEKK